MSPGLFIELVQAQLEAVPWLHTLNAPLESPLPAILPADFGTLLSQSNGFSLRHLRFNGEIVGTSFEVPGLAELRPLLEAMYGASEPWGENSAAVPRAWLAVGRHTDSTFFVGLDPACSTYYSVAPIVPEEAEVIARSCPEYLEWLCQFLPTREELRLVERET